MGYTTNFTGKMKIDPPLNSDQVNYINKFNNTRRMSRDASICAKMPDPVREAVGLPVGIEGEFFVGGLGFAGQDNDKVYWIIIHHPALNQVFGVNGKLRKMESI